MKAGDGGAAPHVHRKGKRPVKVSIELNDRDWGKVTAAVESQLGRERYYASLPCAGIEQAKRVATIARIKQAIAAQRKAGKEKQK